jgi:hypothetical protein
MPHFFPAFTSVGLFPSPPNRPLRFSVPLDSDVLLLTPRTLTPAGGAEHAQPVFANPLFPCPAVDRMRDIFTLRLLTLLVRFNNSK